MRNRKKNDISHLMGYENLGFSQIREKLLNHVISNTSIPITLKGNLEKQDWSERPSSLTTSKEKTVQEISSKPISLNEYVQKQKLLKETSFPTTSTPNSTNTVCKTDARHSLKSQQDIPKHCLPSNETKVDPTIIWIILYMINLILTKPKRFKPNSSEIDSFTGISQNELMEVFKSKRKITFAKYIATTSGILENFGHVPNKYVDKFRINPKLLNSNKLGKVVLHPCINSDINTLLIDAQERRNSAKPMDDVTQYSLRILKTLRIRKKEALTFIETSFAKEYDQLKVNENLTEKAQEHLVNRRDREVAYVLMVDQIKDFAYAKRDDFGKRLHSLFTQSPKRLRPYLYFQRAIEDDLVILDLANAQPLLMVIVLMEKYRDVKWREFGFEFDKLPTFLQLLRKQGGNEDVIRYINCVQEGRLYEEVFRLMIAARFKIVKPLFNSCAEYINKNKNSEMETLTLIQEIHSKLTQIRQLIRLDEQNEKTQQVQKSLNRIRKQNLLNPSLIDDTFVLELHNAIARAYNSDMSIDQRKKIKTDIARHVFYGLLNGQTKKRKPPKPKPFTETAKRRKPYPVLIKQVFRESFPKVWEVIEDIKRFDYTALAMVLQGREANIFVDHILRGLIVKNKKPYFLSIHDGILCTQNDVELLKNIIAAEFNRWGLQVPLNIENVTSGETRRVILNQQHDVFKQRYITIKKDGKMINLLAKAS